MIKTKAIIPLIVGLGVGLYAVKMGLDLVQKARGDGVGGQVVKIAVSRQEIPMGTMFTEEMLELVDVPKVLAPARTFNNTEDLVGRVTKNAVLVGGYISEDLLAAPGSSAGIEMLIKPGFRAVSVKVDEFTGVAGFIKPGARVDVIVVMAVKNGSKRDTISQTLLQDIEVAAVGQEMAQSGEVGGQVARSVTLLVNPKDAAALHLADTKGEIRLALRQKEDSELGDFSSATESALVSGNLQTSQNERPEPEKPGWWSGLAEGIASGAARRPVMAAPRTPRYDPWEVVLIQGNHVEQLFFADSTSTKRVDPQINE